PRVTSCPHCDGGACCGAAPKPGGKPGDTPVGALGIPGMPPNCAPAATGTSISIATSGKIRPTVMIPPKSPPPFGRKSAGQVHTIKRICRGRDIRAAYLALLLAAGTPHWLYGPMVVAAADSWRPRRDFLIDLPGRLAPAERGPRTHDYAWCAR